MSIIVARARACVGTRFRPQGRDPAVGLDCVGLVAFACDRHAPADYALSSGDTKRIARVIAGQGLHAIDPEIARPGDVLLLAVTPGQLHLAIRSDAGIIHADARLRRVIEVPGDPCWPMIAAWRKSEES